MCTRSPAANGETVHEGNYNCNVPGDIIMSLTIVIRNNSYTECVVFVDVYVQCLLNPTNK